MSVTSITRTMVENQMNDFDTLMSPLDDVITGTHRSRIEDSQLMQLGIATFTHEFGPKALQWLYRRYTYLFEAFVRQTGILFNEASTQKEMGRAVRLDLDSSLIATLILLESRDVADFKDGVFTLTHMTYVGNRVCKEFSVPSDMKSLILGAVRHNYISYCRNGKYHCGLTALKMMASSPKR